MDSTLSLLGEALTAEPEEDASGRVSDRLMTELSAHRTLALRVSAQHPCSSGANQGIGSPAGADRLSNRGRGSPSEVRHAEMWK